MSYSCTYHCFSPEVADQKWQSEDLSKFARYEDGDLLQHDLELGSVCTVVLSGNEYSDIVALLEAHDISIDGYPTLENIRRLLSCLDSAKVRSVTQDDETNQYEADIRKGFDTVLGINRQILENDDTDESEYSIEEIQKYMVPLFEVQGMMLYSKVSKKQIRDFSDNFSDEMYEKAVSSVMTAYERAVSGFNESTEETLLKNLSKFKDLVRALDNDPNYIFVFSDSETALPATVRNRLIKIKALL